jgi:hypothetical protein
MVCNASVLIVLVTLAHVNAAFAAIYPTRPTSDTVYSAGRRELITWIDDVHRPHISELGLLDVKLYTSDNVSFIVA